MVSFMITDLVYARMVDVHCLQTLVNKGKINIKRKSTSHPQFYLYKDPVFLVIPPTHTRTTGYRVPPSRIVIYLRVPC